MSHKIRRLTESDLRDAIDHLKYEMEMMKDVAILLSAGHQYSRIVGNALVESYVIHARALIMFLYYAPREDDDVMAVNYFPDGEWQKMHPEMPPVLRKTLERANKEVAHLTTFRIGKELVEKRWEHRFIARGIFDIFRVFFDEVSATLMPGGYMEWFNSHYAFTNKTEDLIDRRTDSSDRST